MDVRHVPTKTGLGFPSLDDGRQFPQRQTNRKDERPANHGEAGCWLRHALRRCDHAVRLLLAQCICRSAQGRRCRSRRTHAAPLFLDTLPPFVASAWRAMVAVGLADPPLYAEALHRSGDVVQTIDAGGVARSPAAASADPRERGMGSPSPAWVAWPTSSRARRRPSHPGRLGTAAGGKEPRR